MILFTEEFVNNALWTVEENALVSHGCHEKVLQTGWQKQQKFILSYFGRLDT